MKILINAITAKMGGFKTLINSFIENINEDDTNEYYFLCPEGIIKKELIKNNNIKIVYSDIGELNHYKRFIWYQTKLCKYIKEEKFNYMINLTNYGPINPGCKQILLLHNPKHVSIEIRNNFNILEKIKLFLQDCVFYFSLKGTNLLVVQTDYMRKRVIEKFKFESKKIVVIPSAPSKIKDIKLDSDLNDKIDKFIGDEKNVMCNITLHAKHKNLELLVDAIKYIKDNNLCKLKLLITVDKDSSNDTRALMEKIDEYELNDYILSVGTINHDSINEIFKKSKVFIFPSYAESFGIPFVEAMKFGLPIIAADLGFAHDVCGDAAVYFEYNNKIDLANKITNLFNHDYMIVEKAQISKKRSLLFNEKKIVKEYINLLNK